MRTAKIRPDLRSVPSLQLESFESRVKSSTASNFFPVRIFSLLFLSRSRFDFQAGSSTKNISPSPSLQDFKAWTVCSTVFSTFSVHFSYC